MKVLTGRSWLQRATRALQALPELRAPQETREQRVLQVPLELRDQLGLPEIQDLLVLQVQLEPQALQERQVPLGQLGHRVIKVFRVFKA